MIRRLAKTGFMALDLLRGPFGGPRLLIYHQVGAGHGAELDVEPAVFVRHLDWLGAAGSVVHLDEALVRAGSPGSERLFALTFDDGYLDMYRNAWPHLRERRLPFTLYLTTAPLETGVPLTAERLAVPLTWDHVGEMSASGLMTVGGHTHHHRDLRGLTESEIDSDLGRCDELIEERLGIRPRHFAYPWGYWSETGDPVMRRRYATAALGGGGPLTAETDPWMLHRIPVQLSDGVVFFRHKMRRGQRTEERVRRLVSGYRGP